jgi:tetratricopeptide (TPR) repeat protein
VPVDKLGGMAPGYISAARQDPDGMSIRVALAQKVTVHSIPAAERLYVDLMPAGWRGLPPGLPQAVIDELARRAREAELKLRNEQVVNPDPTIRVKVGVQPTFIRYVFDLPDAVTATPEQGRGTMTLRFNRPVKLDLADAQATLPPSVSRIDSDRKADAASVTFHLNGKPTVRSFRDDRSLMIDIATSNSSHAAAGMPSAVASKSGDIVITPPLTIPSVTMPAGEHGGLMPRASDRHDTQAHAEAAKPAPAAAAKADAAPGVAAMAAADTTKSEPKPKAAMAKAEPAKPDVSKAEPAKVALAKPSPAADAGEKHNGASAKASAVPAPDVAPAFVHLKAADAAPPPPAAGHKAETGAAPPDAQAKSAAVANVAKPPMSVSGEIKVTARPDGAGLRIDFPFADKTPAAVFRHGRALWLVFDTDATLNIAALVSHPAIGQISTERTGDGATVLRVEFAQDTLFSFVPDGPVWTLLTGDTVVRPTRPIAIARSIVGKGRSSITIPFAGPQHLHVIKDKASGDKLIVVTALPPARGFLKAQDFIELRALASIQGVAIQPLADDVTAEISADKIVVTRPGGLSLSSASLVRRDNAKDVSYQPLVFDNQTWGFDRHADFEKRQSDLMNRAADAPEQKRLAARLDLARFYLARDLIPEAKGVLQVATEDERDNDPPTGSILKSVSDVLMGRPKDALKALAEPQVGNSGDAPIWRAMAHAAEGDCAKARDEFKAVDAGISALPIELQRRVRLAQMRCNVAVQDFAGASTVADDFETLGAPGDIAAALQVLTGRLQEGLGHDSLALESYRKAAASTDRRDAAQGKLRELVLRAKLGDLKRSDMISALEDLTTDWRGDATEAEALKLLAHYYTEENRYRDAFHVMKTAMLAHPNSDMTRQIQDEAANTFDRLFLGGGDAAMPPIEALGLFYDYRELTPIGRRGDEMIRHLADRLVSVDLLDQAAELLQHQVDYRLQGAARAQVAAKLATIYLMNRKPDMALAAIQKTRVSDIAGDLRDQRLLLEARAMSEIGRHEVALEVVEDMNSPQAQHLRADVLWAAKRWREAAEALEKLHGDRWEVAGALSPAERMDVLRMAIGYALSDEQLSLSRLRERYGPKMADGPDRHAFDVVTAPIGPGSSEFQAVAATVSGLKTLDAFLADMNKRYPDKPLDPGVPQASAPQTRPAKEQVAKSDAKAPAPAGDAAKAKPDKSPTGSIARRPRR